MSSELPTLIHIHIPKTAGRSLNTILRPLYPKHAQIDATGATPEQKLQNMDAAARARIRLVAGHCCHGVHRLLPHAAHYLVILRDPGPRIFSLYNYIRRTSSHPLEPFMRENAVDFGAFLELGDTRPGLLSELHNGQMRRIAGNMGPPQHMEDEETLLEQACSHLSASNMLFGFTEEFESYLMRLQAENLLPNATPTKQNVAPPGTSYTQACAALTPTQADRLARYCALDERLVTFARDITAAKLSDVADEPAR